LNEIAIEIKSACCKVAKEEKSCCHNKAREKERESEGEERVNVESLEKNLIKKFEIELLLVTRLT
jgi:hypothetical protein